MGLDIYLYHSAADPKDIAAFEARIENAREKCWDACGKSYEQMTEYEKTTAREAANAVENELREANPELAENEAETPPSQVNPGHLFNLGYFRSSYNGAGFNSVIDTLLGKRGLYWIFDVEEVNYRIKPDWRASYERAVALLVEFDAAILKTGGLLKVEPVSGNPFVALDDQPATATAALKIASEELARPVIGGLLGSWYSNSRGQFMPGKEGMHVRALIPGVNRSWNGTERCVYVVWEASEETCKSYRDSLAIVAESCEWVLAQPDPENYLLHWSS